MESLQVAVGRRDEAHIRPHGPGSADALELLFLQEREAAWPGGPGRMSPISSRKSVPPSATSSLAPLELVGAGEGPLLVTEEVALQEFFGQRHAIDGRRRGEASLGSTGEWPAPGSPSPCRSRPRIRMVALLAAACWAIRIDLQNGGALADQRPLQAVELPLEAPVLLAEAVALQRLLDRPPPDARCPAAWG